jgi:hypothetical protein
VHTTARLGWLRYIKDLKKENKDLKTEINSIKVPEQRRLIITAIQDINYYFTLERVFPYLVDLREERKTSNHFIVYNSETDMKNKTLDKEVVSQKISELLTVLVNRAPAKVSNRLNTDYRVSLIQDIIEFLRNKAQNLGIVPNENSELSDFWYDLF